MMRVSLLLFALLGACGYTLAQAERAPKGFTRFYVNQAMDAATDVGPAATVTRVLRQRVGASRAASLVPLDQAEGVLEARIEGTSDAASISVTGGSEQVSVPSFVVRMTGTLRIVDATGAIAWVSGQVSVDETYLKGPSQLDSSVPVTESNRRRALERAAERLGNELYARLMEGF